MLHKTFRFITIIFFCVTNLSLFKMLNSRMCVQWTHTGARAPWVEFYITLLQVILRILKCNISIRSQTLQFTRSTYYLLPSSSFFPKAFPQRGRRSSGLVAASLLMRARRRPHCYLLHLPLLDYIRLFGKVETSSFFLVSFVVV